VTDLRAALAETADTADLSPLRLHVAEPGEERLILDLLDDAVRWMNERGNTEQWGTEPFSAIPARVEQAKGWVDAGGAVLATYGDRPVGALVLGEAPAYVPAADEPEVYVVLLVSGRDAGARGVGRRLLGLAHDVATRMGVGRLRIDCYGGGDGALVRYYESAGFAEIGEFTYKETWPGRVLERRL
jgi:GNAT superfamily N-acetyltransferase